MLDFKKNRSKILAVTISLISCTSLVLSVLAFNHSKKSFPPEPFGFSHEQGCMGRPKDKGPHNHHRKDFPKEGQKNPENPKENKKQDGQSAKSDNKSEVSNK